MVELLLPLLVGIAVAAICGNLRAIAKVVVVVVGAIAAVVGATADCHCIVVGVQPLSVDDVVEPLPWLLLEL